MLQHRSLVHCFQWIDRCLTCHLHMLSSSPPHLETQARGSLCCIVSHSGLPLAVLSLKGRESTGSREFPHQEHVHMPSTPHPHPHLTSRPYFRYLVPKVSCQNIPICLPELHRLCLPNSNCTSGIHSSRLEAWPVGSFLQGLWVRLYV